MKERIILVMAIIACQALPLHGQQARYRDPVFSQVKVTKDVAFGSAVHRYTNQTQVLRMDIYEPDGDTIAARPVLMMVHGGGFYTGDKAGPHYTRVCTEAATRGFVSVSIDYRLRPSGGSTSLTNITDASHDMKAAVRWLRKNQASLRIDEERIGCIGSSAGAVTCCQTAYTSDEGQSGNPGYSSEVHAVVDMWGYLYDVTAMTTGEAPVQIIHGDQDTVVPYGKSVGLKRRADRVGVTAELHTLVGHGHAAWGVVFNSYLAPHIFPFLYQHLRLGQLIGLSAKAGYASPGKLTMQHFGVAGDQIILALAGGSASIPMGDLGMLELAPSSLVVLPTLGLSATPRLPSRSVEFAVPAGLSGLQVYWQALHVKPGGIGRLLTNAVLVGL
jgi:dienelactone hydrolase